MEYYPAIKKLNFDIHPTAWTNLENIGNKLGTE